MAKSKRGLRLLLTLTCYALIVSLIATAVVSLLLWSQYSINNTESTVKTTAATTTTTRPTSTTLDPIFVKQLYSRLNCFPEQQLNDAAQWSVTKEECEKRGCTFDSTSYGVAGVPTCYMSSDKVGYAVDVITRNSRAGQVLFQATLKPLSNSTAIYDPPIETVMITVQVISEHHLRIKIEDYANQRYEVPFESPMDLTVPTSGTNDYEFLYSENPFSFKVVRMSSGVVLFDTSMGGFVFSDRFLQLSTRLPSENLYGLGEHEHDSLKHDLNYKTWPMFARDQGGLGQEVPLYGVHPFYLVLENDGNSHGVFLLNSNAMEYAVIPAPGIVIRTIGGIFDFHIYTGPTAENVVQQHTEFVGRPYLPPYWSLGFHLSRYGYNNLENMKEAVERTRSYGIPLDVIYADIDHMDERKDFTLDTVNFGGLPEYFANESATNGLRSVIILDPAVTNNATNYEPWDMLNGNDTFITWEDGSPMMGYVWPDGQVAFPDFFLNRTQAVWTDLIKRHAEVIPFDGLWIDMNEPANFGTNEEKPFNYPPDLPPWSLKCPLTGYDNPPYRTRAVSAFDWPDKTTPLCDKTLCMEARQNDRAYRHYDVHNLYGLTQSMATYNALQETKPGLRSFLLSRSTFAGSGTVASHWLGDNVATWDHMRRSIIGILEMSMFGIPHTGADICGFWGVPSAELCKRWMELGAFYPYSRNHNDNSSPPQDPGYFGPEVAASAHAYLDTRYLMLPYMYTLFYLAHTTGTTVARPLFFEWPEDSNTWDIDRQFMIGKWFMVAPILSADQKGVTAYVPKGIWLSYDFSDSFHDFCSGGRNYDFKQSGLVLLQRGGSIITFQSTGGSFTPGYHVISTKTSRLQDFFIQAVFDCDHSASGVLFWDDGESQDNIESGKYWLMSYSASYNDTNLVFEAKIDHASTDSSLGSNLNYYRILFTNVPEPVDTKLTCSSSSLCPNVDDIGMSYDEKTKTVTYDLKTLSQKINFIQNWSITATFATSPDEITTTASFGSS